MWAAMYLPALGTRELRGEEGLRIFPALTMLETGDWLVPHVGGEAYHRKPPFINWLIAGSFSLTGEQSELSARLPSAVLILAFASMLVWLRGDWLSLEARLVAAIIFLSSLGVIDKGRLIELEAIYIGLTSMAVFTWWNTWARSGSTWALWLAPGIFLAAGMLTKGPPIFVFYYVPVVCILAYAGWLQMFAHLGRTESADGPSRLTHENLVNPGTHAEALYDVAIYHAAARLAPFVEMVTHSATLNHGGGLRKSRERVYANPCHYAQSMFAAFTETVPVKADLTCPTKKAPLVLADLRNVTKDWGYETVDALAARAPNGDLLLSIVQKGTEPIQLNIVLKDFEPAGQARIETLAADVPWAQNTLEAPEAIAPATSTMQFNGAELPLRLKPYSYTLVRIPYRGPK